MQKFMFTGYRAEEFLGYYHTRAKSLEEAVKHVFTSFPDVKKLQYAEGNGIRSEFHRKS